MKLQSMRICKECEGWLGRLSVAKLAQLTRAKCQLPLVIAGEMHFNQPKANQHRQTPRTLALSPPHIASPKVATHFISLIVDDLRLLIN